MCVWLSVRETGRDTHTHTRLLRNARHTETETERQAGRWGPWLCHSLAVTQPLGASRCSSMQWGQQ